MSSLVGGPSMVGSLGPGASCPPPVNPALKKIVAFLYVESFSCSSIELMLNVPFDTKLVISGTLFPASLLAGTEKLLFVRP